MFLSSLKRSLTRCIQMLIIVYGLSSCGGTEIQPSNNIHQISNVNPQFNTEEVNQIELFSLAVNELTTIPITPTPASDEEHFDSVTYSKEINAFRDTTIFNLKIHDSLVTALDISLKRYDDTAFFGLSKLIFNGDSPLPIHHNFSEVEKRIKYEITDLNPDDNDFTRPLNYLGKITFSKIVFDKTSKKALFFMKQNCGYFCGFWWAILGIKKDGKWNLNKKVSLGIS